MPGVLELLSSCAKPLRPGGAAGATRKGEPDFSLPTLSAESVAIGFFSGRSHFDRQGSEKGPGEANYDDEEEEEDAGEHDEFMEAAENLFGTTRIAMAQVYGSPDLLKTFLPPPTNRKWGARTRRKKKKKKKRKRAKCPTGLSERRRLSSFHVTT